MVENSEHKILKVVKDVIGYRYKLYKYKMQRKYSEVVNFVPNYPTIQNRHNSR
jgi:hypothetical protein